MKHYLIFASPIGNIMIIEQDSNIIGIELTNKTCLKNTDIENKVLLCAQKQLEEYFLKERINFDLPIKLVGSDFQVKVWNELLNISYGEVKTYGEIAKLIGNENASRAVGMACNRNPLMIIVPCHRVIGKNKQLVGYAGGINIKQKLLDLEGSKFDE